MRQAAKDDIGPKLVRAARRDNLKQMGELQESTGRRTAQMELWQSIVFLFLPFLAYRKQRAPQTQ
jgi:hypothetical protein